MMGAEKGQKPVLYPQIGEEERGILEGKEWYAFDHVLFYFI